MALSNNAHRVLGWLREEYIKAGYPEHLRWGFAPESGDVTAFRELGAHGYIKPFTFRDWILTERGLEALVNHEPKGEASINLHHHGDVHMGPKFVTNITGSHVGAFAQGDGAVANGHVTIGAPRTPTQEQHRAAIKEAHKALLDDEDRLDAAVYKALERFLKLAREVQVEPREIGEVQADLQRILDHVWKEHAVKVLVLPKGLNVIEALAKSPATAEVLKKLQEA